MSRLCRDDPRVVVFDRGRGLTRLGCLGDPRVNDGLRLVVRDAVVRDDQRVARDDTGALDTGRHPRCERVALDFLATGSHVTLSRRALRDAEAVRVRVLRDFAGHATRGQCGHVKTVLRHDCEQLSLREFRVVRHDFLSCRALLDYVSTLAHHVKSQQNTGIFG